MIDQKAVDEMLRVVRENSARGSEFIVGVIGGQHFIATVHSKGPQRYALKNGITIEVLPPESNEIRR